MVNSIPPILYAKNREYLNLVIRNLKCEVEEKNLTWLLIVHYPGTPDFLGILSRRPESAYSAFWIYREELSAFASSLK